MSETSAARCYHGAVGGEYCWQGGATANECRNAIGTVWSHTVRCVQEEGRLCSCGAIPHLPTTRPPCLLCDHDDDHPYICNHLSCDCRASDMLAAQRAVARFMAEGWRRFRADSRESFGKRLSELAKERGIADWEGEES